MIDPDQYDGFVTHEKLNLSPQEIEDLRNNKKTMTEYAREKFKALDLARQAMIEYKDSLEEMNDD